MTTRCSCGHVPTETEWRENIIGYQVCLPGGPTEPVETYELSNCPACHTTRAELTTSTKCYPTALPDEYAARV